MKNRLTACAWFSAFLLKAFVKRVNRRTPIRTVRLLRSEQRSESSEILKKYIDGELYKWTETFPISLYKEIFRLKGWAWNTGKMPSVVGHYTNDLVYDRLTRGMLEELKRLNPQDSETGRRKHKNYSFLTPDMGYPALNQRLYELVGMAHASTTWESFYQLVDRTYPKMGDTPMLPFTDSD